MHDLFPVSARQPQSLSSTGRARVHLPALDFGLWALVFLLLAAVTAVGQAPRDPVDHALELLRQNRVAEARTELEAALEDDPDNTRAAFYLAEIDLQTGRLREAIERARELVDDDPGNSDARALLARAYQASAEWSLAEKEWRAVIERRPASESAHTELAEVLAQLGRSQEALAELNRAIEINPARAAPYALKGNLLAAQGQAAEAEREWNQALARDPNNAAALTGLAIHLKQSDPVRALEYARRAVELTNWKAAGPIRVLVLVYRTRGEVVKAREVLEQALKKLPDNPVLEAELAALGQAPPAPKPSGPQTPPEPKKPER